LLLSQRGVNLFGVHGEACEPGSGAWVGDEGDLCLRADGGGDWKLAQRACWATNCGVIGRSRRPQWSS